MRIRIVFKLFVLTSGLCLLILTTIFVGQTYFFKQFYADRKIEELTKGIEAFTQNYREHPDRLVKMEQDFYDKHNAWIAAVDQYGDLKNVPDFYLEIEAYDLLHKTRDHLTTKVPLSYLINNEDVVNDNVPFEEGMKLTIYGIQKGSNLIPYLIGLYGIFPERSVTIYTPDELKSGLNSTFWQNPQLSNKVSTLFPNGKQTWDNIAASPVTMVIATITKVQLPDISRPVELSQRNNLFMERVKSFQADLLLDPNSDRPTEVEEKDFEQDGVKYKLLIKSMMDKNGETTYLFSMASLQPVDEAVQMVKEYYIYIIAFVIVLILLASFYYSKKIAGPLLRINRTAQKIANLDFSERISIKSKDEIGDLSKNINFLSQTLHSHIQKLKQDIAKEKQLENTRKEFIAGVSHELKTPLSIMKSCMSILKDGVAAHKKDYYFDAMANEVDKMDHLITDMLELAKFESGTYHMQLEPFYIDEVIEQLYQQLSVEMEKKQLRVQLELLPIEVIANQHRIEQVLTNFLTNAIRHTPETGELFISTIEEQEYVKVSIENTGSQIHPDQLDKIWDRFYRGDNTRQRSKEGTGLGLAISKNILKLHDVPYGVVNTERGVLFFFYLHKNQ